MLEFRDLRLGDAKARRDVFLGRFQRADALAHFDAGQGLGAQLRRIIQAQGLEDIFNLDVLRLPLFHARRSVGACANTSIS